MPVKEKRQRFSAENLPENFAPYTADEVAEYRSEILLDAVSRRGELLGALQKIEK
jgi:hypothetical protein